MAIGTEYRPGSDTERHNIIAVGASAGGVEALRQLVDGLPWDLAAAVFVTVHIGPNYSALPEILTRSGPLPACHPTDGQPIQAGRIYVAPPDYHLLIVDGLLRLSRGPKENHTRPAVDPMFRSAARAYGSGVVGIVLSGNLGDGTAGLAEIKRFGGTTIVQDPAEALYPGMPLSALRYTSVDHCLPLAGMPALLTQLAGRLPPQAAKQGKALPTAREPGMSETGYTLNSPAALTCPTCGGALSDTTEDSMPYFTCHIGHRFSASDMDEAQFQQMEGAMEVALRSMNERAALCERMIASSRQRGLDHVAKQWDEARREAKEKADILRSFIERDWQRPDLTTGSTAISAS